MRTGLHFTWKYFSFTSTSHIVHGDTRLQRQSLFDPYGDVITGSDSLQPCKPAYGPTQSVGLQKGGCGMDNVWIIQFFIGYHYFQTGCGAHPASYPGGTRGRCTRGKAVEAEFEAEWHDKLNLPYILCDAGHN